MDDDDDKVVSLVTGKPITEYQATVDRGEYCPHRWWSVSEKNRTLRCQHCGKDVDPFDALVRVAREYDLVADAKAELKALRKHIENLHAEEKRAKSRLENAIRKDADAAVAEERAKWQERLRRFARKARDIEREAGLIAKGLEPGGGKRRP